MFKRGLGVVVGTFVAVAVLAGCNTSAGQTEDDTAPVSVPADDLYYEDMTVDSGFGMTYGGKVGFDMGGIVIPFDGSTPGLGFGF